MKSTVSELNQAERNALALFYDSEAHKALKKLARAEIVNLGVDALQSPNHEHTRYLSGRAMFAKDLMAMIKLIYDESNKKG